MTRALNRRSDRRRLTEDPGTGVRLVWHERQVELLPLGQLRITVPLLGGTLGATDTAALSRVLERLWVQGSVPRFSSVVAMIEDRASPRRRLTLLLGGAETSSGSRVDDIAMARQLRSALTELDGPALA